MRIVFVITLFVALGWGSSLGAVPHLLPCPQEVEWNRQKFVLKEVALQTGVLKEEIENWVIESGGRMNEKAKRVIEVRLTDHLEGIGLNEEEGYILNVHSNRIVVEAVTERGAYWALQTLRQLTDFAGKTGYVQGCRITDWPAFRVRGFMHDVGRGYVPVDELKREIALLARYKVNVFHWHLTEDMAWRLESRIFPMLNDSINFGRYPGKYYTLAEARDLVDFCWKHGMMLIPEVDMPGHSAAFRKTFRHDMQSPEGMSILKLLMDEVCEAFKEVPYIHIGTDEVAFTNPEFVPEMVAYIRAKGKKVISWNPGWKYKAGEIDMLHMWSSRGRPHPGIPVIDSRLHYLNHYDAFADIVALYNSNIAEQAEGSPDYAGTILAVWNDRRVDGVRNILVQNGFYPAMLTMAERAWKGGGNRYFYEAGTLFPSRNTPEYAAFADFEERMLWHKEHHFQNLPFAYVRQTGVRWRITDPFPNGGDLLKSFPPEKELQPSYLYKGKNYSSAEAEGAAIYLRHVWGTLIPSFYKDPKPDHTAYAWTWVWSPVEQEVGMWLGTQNYGRSEADIPPPAGKWDFRESRVWLNDTEILPPVWTNIHTVKSNEIPLGNENFEVRPPVSVHLKKGWNKVLLKLPVGKFSSSQVRLVKWMYTAVFVTPDGKDAVKGLIYSPDKQK